jgi:hypothetical protein
MNALRTLFVFAVCSAVMGCASIGGSMRAETGPGVVRAGAMTPQRARDGIAIGKSTKADVTAALGRANVIHFDSGYEVWLYRWLGTGHTTRNDTELVILFAPDGVVKKTRIRPPYAPE